MTLFSSAALKRSTYRANKRRRVTVNFNARRKSAARPDFPQNCEIRDSAELNMHSFSPVNSSVASSQIKRMPVSLRVSCSRPRGAFEGSKTEACACIKYSSCSTPPPPTPPPFFFHISFNTSNIFLFSFRPLRNKVFSCARRDLIGEPVIVINGVQLFLITLQAGGMHGA